MTDAERKRFQDAWLRYCWGPGGHMWPHNTMCKRARVKYPRPAPRPDPQR